MIRKGYEIFAVLLAVMLLFAGCGGIPAAKAENKTETSDYEALTFDNYGREITVKKMPEKVLTLGPNCSELFVALGLGDYIIGNTLNNHSRGPLPEYAEAYNKIPELNYSSATREAVISSGADFIYGIDWEFGDEGLDTEELEQMGMTTYMNSATDFDQIYKEINDIGKIFKIEGRAQAFIDGQESRISEVEEKIKDKSKIKVLYLRRNKF